MICPSCEVQTHQDGKRGGGEMKPDSYEVWTVQVCPECDERFVEYYVARRLAFERVKEAFLIEEVET